MPGYELRYLPCAQKDIREAADFVRLKGRNAEELFFGDFNRAVAQIVDDPQNGTAPKDETLEAQGYRMKLIDNYFMFYRVQAKTVQVYRFIQGFRGLEFLM